jgi:DNA modification methylase
MNEKLELALGVKNVVSGMQLKIKLSEGKCSHPTVKPVKLMEYLIKMVTPKGGIVLDPFAGSGTTGVACKNLNRNYILIEKEPEYVKIAEARLTKLNDSIHPYPKDLGILPTTI